MRFLIDADLPRSTKELLENRGHEGIDVRDIGLGSAKDQEIIAYAQNKELAFITGDFDFSDIRNYPPNQYFGLVVLKIPKNATAKFILKLVESLLIQKEIIERLPGKLAIVEFGYVRIR